MRRLAALTILSALGVAACGTQPAPTVDPSATVQYWLDFGGANIPIAEGQVAAGVGGWTSKFGCAYSPNDTKPDAVRFDDAEIPNWDASRDGGTPPPLTRSGTGVSLRVEPDGKGSFIVSLVAGTKTFTGTAPADGPTVGFHHVSYEMPPELLAIEKLKLTSGDGSTVTLTGTASFPMACNGL